MNLKQYDCIIIGGGAAGLMAAGACAARGGSVLVLEKNKVIGRKIRITGKGRCNVTNQCQPADVIAAVPGNGKFLYSAVHQFTPSDAMAFFEAQGVALKTERGNRVFPRSDSAHDIADTLYRYALDNGVAFLAERAVSVKTGNGKVTGVQTKTGLIGAQSVLIATGGKSYPRTGSDGDGYRFAKDTGHTVTTIRPSLVPLVADGSTCAELQGLSLRNCSVTVLDEQTGKVIYTDFGELLFTHFGLSGPVILSASAHMRDMAPERYTVFIDLKPALDEKKLDERVQRDLQENQNKIFANSLDALLPKKMIPVIIKRMGNLTGIKPETKCNEITRGQRKGLVKLLKEFKITIQAFRPIDEAIITAGGVSTKEINPKTMESKLVSGLYFAGEVLDVDAYTGGYNLQIAFSTGYAAGVSMI